ncbi:hypothetical protein HOY82DRAFT_611481 [Tuber indicum]|nr:hypothetical protein HOY82DRAFT_611481 [Tuber indicum]
MSEGNMVDPVAKVPGATGITIKLRNVILKDRKGLQNMYGRTEADLNKSLQMPIEIREEMTRKLIKEMGCSYEAAVDLAVLTLYDATILIDDSTSMIHKEGGKRKETLIDYNDHITEIYTLANQSGILAMRFMNTGGGKKNWTGQSRQYLEQHSYGSIEGERKGHLQDIIRECVHERDRAGKWQESVTFQLSRIGNYCGAAQLLKNIDQDPVIAEYIDVLPIEFGLKMHMEDKWCILPKIFLGAILPDWDTSDYYDFGRPQGNLPTAGGSELHSENNWDD